MKTKILLLITVLFSFSVLAEEPEVFSDYSGDFKIKEISYGMPYVKFEGTIEITGTLVFRLDQIGEGKFGEPMFADFIPSKEDLSIFPVVVSGRYPRELDMVGVYNIDEAFAQTGQNNIEHTAREVRVYGTAIFKDYSTSIECDSRQYFATLVSFKINPNIAAISRDKVSGC